MTKEEKKKWLNRAFELSLNQSNLDAELEEVRHYRDKCTDISVKTGDGASRSGGNSTEANLINYAAASAAYEQSVRTDREEYYRVKGEIKRAIDAVEDPMIRAVLTARYLNFKKTADIAKERNYSKRQIERLLDIGADEIKVVA